MRALLSSIFVFGFGGMIGSPIWSRSKEACESLYPEILGIRFGSFDVGSVCSFTVCSECHSIEIRIFIKSYLPE